MTSGRIEICRIFSQLYLELRFAYFPGEAFVTCNCLLDGRPLRKIMRPGVGRANPLGETKNRDNDRNHDRQHDRDGIDEN